MLDNGLIIIVISKVSVDDTVKILHIKHVLVEKSLIYLINAIFELFDIYPSFLHLGQYGANFPGLYLQRLKFLLYPRNSSGVFSRTLLSVIRLCYCSP